MTLRFPEFYGGQMGVPGSDTELGLHPEPFRGFGAGNVYYVNGYTGNNTNSGYTPDNPFLTITKAISMCQAHNHDYVIVLRYPSAGATGETWPLALSVETMHLIGCNQNGASPLAWLAPTGDTAAIVISAGGIEVAGFDIRGGATHGCIENGTAAAVWRAHIHHNEFGWIGAGQDGIRLTGTVDCPHWLIEDNKFGNNVTRDGVRIEYNSTRTIIRRNVFRRVPGIAIDVVNTFALGGIFDNKFFLPSNTAGKAITFAATATDGATVAGNDANYGDTAMANNPYSDGSAAGSNDWGTNYKAGTATMPA